MHISEKSMEGYEDSFLLPNTDSLLFRQYTKLNIGMSRILWVLFGYLLQCPEVFGIENLS
jgi:hypothetical protein